MMLTLFNLMDVTIVDFNVVHIALLVMLPQYFHVTIFAGMV